MLTKPLRLATVVAMSLIVAALISPVSAAGDALSKAQTETLEKVVVPAYRNGSALETLKGLSPLLAKMKPAAMQEADALLKKRNVPPVARLLGEARLALVRQGMGRKMPRASKAEVLLVLPLLHQRVAGVLKQVADHPAWKAPPGKGQVLKEYGQWLDALGVLDSMLASSAAVAQYAGRSSKVVSRVKFDALSAAQRAAVSFDFAAAEKKLSELRGQL